MVLRNGKAERTHTHITVVKYLMGALFMSCNSRRCCRIAGNILDKLEHFVVYLKQCSMSMRLNEIRTGIGQG